MKKELKNTHEWQIHQMIVEKMADLLDDEDLFLHQTFLGFSDSVEREKSELHIRMADVAYLEYKKTMNNNKKTTMKALFRKFLYVMAVTSVILFLSLFVFSLWFWSNNQGFTFFDMVLKFWRAFMLCVIVFVMCEILYRIENGK